MASFAQIVSYLLVSSLILLKGTQAEGIQVSLRNPDHNCVEGINSALVLVSFGDKDPEADYYTALCNSVWHTTSLAMTTMKWCTSEKQKDAGWKRMSGYCKEYGDDTILPSWEELLAQVNQSNVMEDVNTVDPEITGTVFNSTIVLSEEAWKAGKGTEDAWTTEQNYHHGFGWGLYILVGIAILVGTLNRIFAIFIQNYATPYDAQERSPYSKGLRGKWYTLYRKHIEVPALFGYKHSQASAWGFLSLPTRLQGLFVFIYVALNIIFTVSGYKVFYENVYWYGERDTQIIRYLSDRTGIMCFYNLPLLWCLAGRNDVILWMTGWSYSTLNLFHRWVARIAVLQAIVHSAGYTWLERGYIAVEMKERYWWTGVVATIVMSLLIPFSMRPFRERFYEAFLIIHISLALVTLVTCWYHVEIWEGAYDPWIWASVAVWCMDRFIRIIRVLVLTYKALSQKGKNTIGTIPSNDENGLIRLSITTSIKIQPKAGEYYFIYTPFSLKPWENHPFTLASWKINDKDNTTSLEFLVAPQKGQTKKWQRRILKHHNQSQNQISNNSEKSLSTDFNFRLLLEGPYGHSNPVQNFDKILFIAGGSGITCFLPYLFKLKLMSVQVPEIQPKQIQLIWIIKNKNYTLDILNNELKEYLELGNCGVIPIKIDLYVTRERESDSNTSPQDIVHNLAYNSQDDPSVGPTASSVKPNNNEILEKIEIKFSDTDYANPQRQNQATTTSSSSSSSHLSSTEVTPDLKASPTFNSSEGKIFTIHSGKPHIQDLVNDSVNALVGGERLAVSACGPNALMDDTRASVCEIYGNDESQGQLQGNRIEYFEELFSW